jgi:hypothetical protein
MAVKRSDSLIALSTTALLSLAPPPRELAGLFPRPPPLRPRESIRRRLNGPSGLAVALACAPTCAVCSGAAGAPALLRLVAGSGAGGTVASLTGTRPGSASSPWARRHRAPRRHSPSPRPRLRARRSPQDLAKPGADGAVPSGRQHGGVGPRPGPLGGSAFAGAPIHASGVEHSASTGAPAPKTAATPHETSESALLVNRSRTIATRGDAHLAHMLVSRTVPD